MRNLIITRWIESIVSCMSNISLLNTRTWSNNIPPSPIRNYNWSVGREKTWQKQHHLSLVKPDVPTKAAHVRAMIDDVCYYAIRTHIMFILSCVYKVLSFFEKSKQIFQARAISYCNTILNDNEYLSSHDYIWSLSGRMPYSQISSSLEAALLAWRLSNFRTIGQV